MVAPWYAVALIVPPTSNLVDGVATPIPMFPPDVTVNAFENVTLLLEATLEA